MKVPSVVAAMILAAGAGSALGQTPTYTFEMRLIPDGAAGAPSGPGTTYPIGDPSGAVATRIGFWLQARVSQVGGQNWGIARATSPSGGQSFVRVTDAASSTSLQMGTVNASNTQTGRGSGYRANGVLGDNGLLDNGGSGGLVRRAYAFDCYVQDVRFDTDFDADGDVDDDGDGLPENPWRVNGAVGQSNASGVPIPDGVFSPWASLYRVWINIGNPASVRDITLDASALLIGAVRVEPTAPGSAGFAIVSGPGQTLTTTYSFHLVPAPGAAVLGIGGLALGMRRR
jgi:hypothetical protein